MICFATFTMALLKSTGPEGFSAILRGFAAKAETVRKRTATVTAIKPLRIPLVMAFLLEASSSRGHHRPQHAVSVSREGKAFNPKSLGEGPVMTNLLFARIRAKGGWRRYYSASTA